MLQTIRKLFNQRAATTARIHPADLSTGWFILYNDSGTGGHPNDLRQSASQESGAPRECRFSDGGFSIYGENVAISNTERFVLAGNVWLSSAKIESGNAAHEAAAYTAEIKQLADLWASQGRRALANIHGVFSFAVWDKQEQTLEIVRDQVGARTMYYGKTSAGSYVIAPALRDAARHTSREIDLVALRDYLCCAFVPGARTMFEAIKEVRPGMIHELPADRSTAYWQLEENYHQLVDESLEWHSKRLRGALADVVGEYLPAGEDVGAYLSGGLDSSSIVALASELHDKQVHCLSIHFGADCPNEIEFSSLMARHVQAKHHVIEISETQMWDMHPEAIALLDDPIGDPLTVPNLILGRYARDLTKVILNGEGGDPCFGGPKNQPMLLSSLYQPASDSEAELERSTSSSDSQITKAYLSSFQKCAGDLPRLLKPEVQQALAGQPSVFESDLTTPNSYINRLMLINTKYKGADHILTKVKSLCDACGVEGRSPLFDPRVVAMSMEIPPEYKLKGALEKAVLKEAVKDIVPESILSRPKSGMMVPVQYWFRAKWQKQARDLLLSRSSKIRPYLDQSVIEEWLNYTGDVWSRFGVKLWLLCSLELWLRANCP